MKKVIIIDGGPRKNWNTAQLLHKAQEGAESTGAEKGQELNPHVTLPSAIMVTANPFKHRLS